MFRRFRMEKNESTKQTLGISLRVLLESWFLSRPTTKIVHCQYMIGFVENNKIMEDFMPEVNFGELRVEQ